MHAPRSCDSWASWNCGQPGAVLLSLQRLSGSARFDWIDPKCAEPKSFTVKHYSDSLQHDTSQTPYSNDTPLGLYSLREHRVHKQTMSTV